MNANNCSLSAFTDILWFCSTNHLLKKTRYWIEKDVIVTFNNIVYGAEHIALCCLKLSPLFSLIWNGIISIHLYFFNHFILHKYISVVSFSHCFLKFLECAFILSCYLHYSGLNLPIYLSISSLLLKLPVGREPMGNLENYYIAVGLFDESPLLS